MARDNKGMGFGPVPNKSSFTYGKDSGIKSRHGGKVVKGGDLRARKGQNNGK